MIEPGPQLVDLALLVGHALLELAVLLDEFAHCRIGGRRGVGLAPRGDLCEQEPGSEDGSEVLECFGHETHRRGDANGRARLLQVIRAIRRRLRSGK
jgi:hypothetical protein